MTTKEVTFTEEELRMIARWADNAWRDADDMRFRSIAGSPQEAGWLEHQWAIEAIQEKVRR